MGQHVKGHEKCSWAEHELQCAHPLGRICTANHSQGNKPSEGAATGSGAAADRMVGTAADRMVGTTADRMVGGTEF